MSCRRNTNKLITVECDKKPDGKQHVFLMGLVKMRRRNAGTEGWIILISGDPLIPPKKGKPYPNRVSIDNLYLTHFQKMTLCRSTFIHDGFAFLYTGHFFIGDSKKCGEIPEQNLNALILLGEHISKHTLEFDKNMVIPFTFGKLREIITPRQHIVDNPKLSEFPPSPPKPEETDEPKEHLKFRKTTKEFFVDLETPGTHSGYRVNVSLLKTVECKSKPMRGCLRREITTILENDSVPVSPSFKGNNYPVTVTVKVFQLPTGGIAAEQRKLEKFEVKNVKYWVKAGLVKNRIKTDVLLRELYLMKRNQKEGEIPKQKPRTRGRRSLTNFESSEESSTSSDEYSLEANPISLVFMEVELDTLEETEDE